MRREKGPSRLAFVGVASFLGAVVAGCSSSSQDPSTGGATQQDVSSTSGNPSCKVGASNTVDFDYVCTGLCAGTGHVHLVDLTAFNHCQLSGTCWHSLTSNTAEGGSKADASLDACYGDATFDGSTKSRIAISLSLPGDPAVCGWVSMALSGSMTGSTHASETCTAIACLSGRERRDHHVVGTFEGKFPGIPVGNVVTNGTSDCVVTNGTFELTTCTDMAAGDTSLDTACGS
jgi:hypothetical protein